MSPARIRAKKSCQKDKKLQPCYTKSTKGRSRSVVLPFVLFVPFVANLLPSSFRFRNDEPESELLYPVGCRLGDSPITPMKQLVPLILFLPLLGLAQSTA